MDFTPIETQEAFDAACKPLVDAAVAEAIKGFEGFISPEEHQAALSGFEGFISPDDHQKALDALEAANREKLLGAYRAKAAALAGLPAELAARLTGDTDEDICKDAQQLAELARKAYETPHADAGSGTADGVEKAFRAKNPELYGNS